MYYVYIVLYVLWCNAHAFALYGMMICNTRVVLRGSLLLNYWWLIVERVKRFSAIPQLDSPVMTSSALFGPVKNVDYQ